VGQTGVKRKNIIGHSGVIGETKKIKVVKKKTKKKKKDKLTHTKKQDTELT